MKKRLMTLDDLYNYYSTQNKTQKFSCEDNGNNIVVQVKGTVHFSKSDNTEGLMPARVQLNFIGDNLNGSRIKAEAQEAALPSAKFRPLLAYIHDVDGTPQFYGHNMHQDEDGNLVYDEQPIGVISEEAHIEHDDEYDMDYAVVNGYIWEEYSKAGEILERDNRCDVSVELAIRELSYDAQDHILNLDNFYYCGCTILGCDDNGNKVNPAMPGSNVTLSDFCQKEEPVRFEQNDKLIETLEKLNATLSSLNINTANAEDSTKGGNEQVTKFEELLQKYSKTVEEITFEYESLSDEELEAAFAEAFDEAETGEPENDADENTNASEGEADGDADGENSEAESTDDNAEGETDDSVKCSVTVGEKVREFSVSMNEKLMAISELVNDTYADDCTWYDCTVYDDTKEVVMVDYWNGKAYKQSYKVKEDIFSLKGDRVPVHSVWMTEDEQKAFDKMKADFSSISDKLAKYEAEPQKMEILMSEDYSKIADTEDYKKLIKQESHFDMSVDDVRAKADEMLLAYAKTATFSVESTVNKSVGKVSLPTINKKSSRYGSLFSK